MPRRKLLPNSTFNSNPKPNPNPNQMAIFLAGNFPDTIIKIQKKMIKRFFLHVPPCCQTEG